MSNTSSILFPRRDCPVDPTTLWVIQKIHNASQALGFPVFLVGAMARIILLENVFGLRAGRATTDVDFAFALDDWQQFATLKTVLLANADFEESNRVAHRLLLRQPGMDYPCKVDLIPFGGIETSPNTIAWPPDMAVMMNVAGYSDALAAAVTVEIQPEIRVVIASLAGMAILKLFAWADRGQENPKDATDLATLLRSYHEAGNESRIYQEEAALAVLSQVGYDLELAGAWLLGNDAAEITTRATKAAINTLLHETTRARLARDMARAMRGREDALLYSHRLLAQFSRSFAV